LVLMEDPTSLVGTWAVKRTIDDRRERRTTRLHGTLSLTVVDEDRLDWHEELTWHLPGGDTPTERRLAVVRTDDGWWVRFDDGRDFHPWVPGEQVVHDCAPDTYRGTVDGTPDGWTIVWEVSGPAKDYTMTSALRRP
jgi:hypothetical protein